MIFSALRLCIKYVVLMRAFIQPHLRTIPLHLLQIRAIPNMMSSPSIASSMQASRIPIVSGPDIFQKRATSLVVSEICFRFIPKNPATNEAGRKRIVTAVKMKMALLLSSCRVSTSWTFSTESCSARLRSSEQTWNCSSMRRRSLSMEVRS